MPELTVAFLAALGVGTAIELYLGHRQARTVAALRGSVPAPFATSVTVAEHAKAADYTLARLRVGRVELLLSKALVLAFTLGGGIAALDLLWRDMGLERHWLGLAVIGSVAALDRLAQLPLDVYRTFRIEARFGFNRTTPALFAIDLLKELLLSALIGGALLWATLILMERAGRLWWLGAWLLWVAVTLLMTWAWPAFIAPLFNRFTPLADASLAHRVEALLTRCGFTSRGVYVVDGSRRSAHGNAYFTGLGRNKRIVFFDTLLEKLGAAEVEAVLAHELGHFRLRHVRARLMVSLLAGLVVLLALGAISRWNGFYAALGVPRSSSHAALLLFALALPAFTWLLTPLGSWWSRRHEFEADAFAQEHASGSDLTGALVKLYRDNASTLTPDPLYSAFYYSHPPAIERIARLQRGGVADVLTATGSGMS